MLPSFKTYVVWTLAFLVVFLAPFFVLDFAANPFHDDTALAVLVGIAYGFGAGMVSATFGMAGARWWDGRKL